jgi:hypothetical protein
VGRTEPAVPDRCRGALDAADIAVPAALGDEATAGPDDRGEVAEERVVVGHPVEGGGRQDGVDRLLDRATLAEVGDDVVHAGPRIARVVQRASSIIGR